MKKMKLIFSTTQNRFILGIFCASILFNVPAFSAQNGCEDENNDRINQELALCSVHAYNIGLVTNPDNPADKQAMNDAVALKTTIMTQQMKRQYDYLETTIKRFKIQLEKSILTSKMEAAGASTDTSGSSSSKSSDKNIILAGTENCNNKSTRAEVYTCLRSNYNLIYNMSNGGQNMNADIKKQLASDFSVLYINNSGVIKKDAEYNGQKIDDCTNVQKISNRDSFIACLQALNAGIRNSSESLTNSTKNNYQATGFNQQPPQ